MSNAAAAQLSTFAVAEQAARVLVTVNRNTAGEIVDVRADLVDANDLVLASVEPDGWKAEVITAGLDLATNDRGEQRLMAFTPMRSQVITDSAVARGIADFLGGYILQVIEPVERDAAHEFIWNVELNKDFAAFLAM